MGLNGQDVFSIRELWSYVQISADLVTHYKKTTSFKFTYLRHWYSFAYYEYPKYKYWRKIRSFEAERKNVVFRHCITQYHINHTGRMHTDPKAAPQAP